MPRPIKVKDPVLIGLLNEHVKDKVNEYWEYVNKHSCYEYPYIKSWFKTEFGYKGELYIDDIGMGDGAYRNPIFWQSILVNHLGQVSG